VLNFEPRPEPANEETTGTDHHDKITPSDADTPEESSEADDAGKGTPLPRHLLTLAVARDTLEMDKDLAALRWLLAGSAAGSVLVMLVVAGLVVRHGLRPLGALAGRIAAIREENLSARIPTGEMPAEMAPVGARLNELLERLDAAFRRERALTADVAHELRTPLGGIQSTIEVTLAQARPPEEYRQALRDCLEIVRQTGGMTANLLSLARLEGGQLPLHPETLRPAELVAALWRPHAASARERGIAFQNQIPPLLACATDREILAIVLANLLANAAEYTGDYGRIEVAGQTQGDTVVMTVRNPGGTLSADDAAHVFDRFWRGDTARSGTGVHCGLGLSLAERAMHVLGGSIAATVTDGTFTATVTLSAREPQNRT
jgi:signal transduction histidine kinase